MKHKIAPPKQPQEISEKESISVIKKIVEISRYDELSDIQKYARMYIVAIDYLNSIGDNKWNLY